MESATHGTDDSADAHSGFSACQKNKNKKTREELECFS